MSAVNVLVQSNAVHLLTDAAIYQPDGMLSGLTQKVRSMPHLNCAAAMRGGYLGLAPIMEEISAAGTSFDSLKANMPALLRGCAAQYLHLLDRCAAGPEFEVVIAGISETDGPSAYVVPSHDRYGEPWTVTDLAGLVALPCDEHLLAEVQRIADGRSADDLDPIKDGLAIFDAQRAHPHLSNGDVCFVGGYAQLTTVTADGIASRIIRRWPDPVGKVLSA